MNWSFSRDKKQNKNHKQRRSNRKSFMLGGRRPRFEELESRQLLTTFTVTNPTDVAVLGQVTLREALASADAADGADIVEFAAAVNGATINLTGVLNINDAVSINALVAANITVNAGPISRVFYIAPTSTDVTIQGLKLTNGDAGGADGGAIFSQTLGNLTIANSTITGSTTGASGRGGAIYAAGNLTLSGTTIGGVGAGLPNTSAGDGGGIYAIGNVSVINNSVITGNTAGVAGGGIFGAANVTVQNSVIGGTAAGSGNVATTSGGGIYGGTVSVQSSTVARNFAVLDGGGIFARVRANVESSTVGGPTVDGNLAGGDGGGIAADTVTVIRSAVSGNSAFSPTSDGGGIHARVNATVQNSTVSGNSADDNGGGIATPALFGTVTLQNATVASNTADADTSGAGGGGGLYAGNRFVSQNSIIIGNSAFNNPDFVQGFFNSIVFTIIGDDTGTGGVAGAATPGPPFSPNAQNNFVNIPIAAVLDSTAGVANLQNNNAPQPATTPTIKLAANSPAINNGSNKFAMSLGPFDQRGAPFTRFRGVVDMGAFEDQPPIPLNIPPVAANAIPPQTAIVGEAFVFTFAPNTFTDADGDSLTYSATLSPTGALPAWITSFPNGTASRTFVGVPTAADIGSITIRVIASDGKGGTATSDFVLTVVATELPFEETFEGPVPPGQIAPNPKLVQKVPSFTTSATNPINGAQSFVATRPNPGARPVATVDFASPASTTAVTSASVNVNISPGNGSTFFSNAIIIFDYVSPTNYKYAGLFQGRDQLIIGQINNGAVQHLKAVRFVSQANTNYSLNYTIDRASRLVTLSSGGVTVSHTFASIGSGPYGLGTLNANARFDNFKLLS